MCGSGSCQSCGCGHLLGIPLSKAVLAAMSEEEASFWRKYVQEAADFAKKQFAAGEPIPFDNPPQSLVEQYQTALVKYDGRKYHDFQSLSIMINFPPADVPAVPAVTG